MNARDVIIRPIVTEKSMKLNDQDNKITFEVAKGANKTQVAMAVKEIYNITPVKVNIVNVRPKTKRMGRYVGKTNAVRKAIVKLPEGQEITLRVPKLPCCLTTVWIFTVFSPTLPISLRYPPVTCLSTSAVSLTNGSRMHLQMQQMLI